MAALRESAPVATQTSTLAVYLRVSGDEQKRKGTIENQRTTLQRYLDKETITPCGWYEDEAISGHFVAFGKRPEGRRLMADIQARAVDMVLVTKLDRFGRNAREILNAVHDLEQAGARLVSLKENVDTRTTAGRFFLTVLAGVAELEADMIMERTSDGKGRRLAAGGWMGGPAPFGYVLVGKQKDARIVVEDQTAESVRAMFDWLLDKRIGCHRIAARLNEAGVAPTSGGKCWRANSVHVVLTNPVYAGRIKHGDEIVAGVHEAIVPPHVFDAAQRVLDASAWPSRREGDRPYLLRGMVRCGHCGCHYRGTYYASGKERTQYRAYVCNTKRDAAVKNGTHQTTADQRCPSVSIQADWLESEIWRDVEHYVRRPDDTLALLAARMSGEADQQEALRRDMADVASQLEAQQQEKDAVIALFRKRSITERDLDRQYAEIDREVAKLQKQYEALASRASASLEAADKLTAARTVLERLAALLDEDSPAARRQLVEGLVSSIVITTEPAGLSRRGKPKRRPFVRVVYCFDDLAQASPRSSIIDASVTTASLALEAVYAVA